MMEQDQRKPDLCRDYKKLPQLSAVMIHMGCTTL